MMQCQILLDPAFRTNQKYGAAIFFLSPYFCCLLLRSLRVQRFILDLQLDVFIPSPQKTTWPRINKHAI